MNRRWTYWLMMVAVGILLVACASIGSPEGGPRDYTPPQVVKSSPAPGTVNFKGNKVEITFDEIINLKDQQKKVVISPAPKTQPLIRTVGKKITIEFRDDLEENTTYVIDFSNAIEDNNEGNQLDGYTFAFSTGDQIDTLAVSGIVLRAKDLEPMQHVIVGLHSNLDDTAFTHIPLERVSRTNDRGMFTIRNLKPGNYHVFAINDVDGDYRMARTEDVAFLDDIIVPTTSEYTSQDTVFTYDRRIDTVMTATHTLYLPNDLLLCMFNEGYRSHYVRQTSRPEANKLHMLFGAPNDSLPTLEVLRPVVHERDWYRVERTTANDSLFYWITDSTMIKTDTIIVAMTYLRTNTDNDSLEMVTDTVRFGYRKPNNQVKEEEKRAKEREERTKRLAQLLEKQEKAATQGKDLNEGELEELKELQRPNPDDTPLLKMEFTKSGTIDVSDSIILKFETPIASIDPAGVHLEIKRDTLWIPVPERHVLQLIDDCNPMRYWLPCTTLPDSTYRVIIDSAAVTSVYGLHNASLTKDFKVRGLEQYANVYFKVNVKDDAFVELLGSGEKVISTVPVKNGAFELLNVSPGTYYLRLTIDKNGNGKWDTGNYRDHRQPEEVYYYPKKLRLRANWDLDEVWNIYQTALDLQKPDDIKRNKPEKAKNKVEKKQNKTDGEDEEEDEFSTGINTNTYTGNKYNDSKNKQLNNRRLNR